MLGCLQPWDSPRHLICASLCSHLLLSLSPALLQVESDEGLAGVTTAEQREAFLKQLTEAEDWLYGDGEDVDGAEYR